MQKLIVIGNVGGDPEMKESKDGLEICKFSIAVNHKRGDNEHTEWFNATAFGKLATNVNRFVKKGNKICMGRSICSRNSRWKKSTSPKI